MTVDSSEQIHGAAAVADIDTHTARGGLEGGVQQFVTFYVEQEVFAFPMASVREIIRMPEVVCLPLSPPALEGLANLRGQILPVVNLRRRFGFAETEYNDATRVVVVENKGLLGFVVDRVASVITVEPHQMESAEAITATVDTDLLTGMIKEVEGHAMIMALDVARLSDFAGRALSTRLDVQQDTTFGSSTDAVATLDTASDERQLVSFVVAEQEYAFAIERVQEIVQVPAQLCHVPNTSAHVLGVMTLRHRLLPLVSLREILGLPPEPLGPQHRIVVTALDQQGPLRTGGVVGIVTDAVKEVLRVPSKLVDSVPAFLVREQQVNEIDAICRLDDGKRLVCVLAVDKLFHHAAVQEAVAAQADAEKETGMTAEKSDEREAETEEQFVVFRLAGEEYGVGIESVQEIIRVPEAMTHVPRTVEYLEGVVNLRGQVLPVVDLRRRFGLASMARDERQRIVVFALQDMHTGFIVDSVSEVLKIAQATIEPVPSLSEEQAQMINRLANLETQQRMILLLEPNRLLDSQALSALAKVKESQRV